MLEVRPTMILTENAILIKYNYTYNVAKFSAILDYCYSYVVLYSSRVRLSMLRRL